MMVLFPFEESYYRSHGVSAKFVGHPAADEIEQITRKQAREMLTGEGLQVDRTTIALLPGSRTSEIDSLGGLFLETAKRIAQDPSVKVVSDSIPNGWMGLDIGPETQTLYSKTLLPAKTIP